MFTHLTRVTIASECCKVFAYTYFVPVAFEPGGILMCPFCDTALLMAHQQKLVASPQAKGTLVQFKPEFALCPINKNLTLMYIVQ